MADIKKHVVIVPSAVQNSTRDNIAKNAFNGVRKFFEDPANAEGYRKWLEARTKKGA